MKQEPQGPLISPIKSAAIDINGLRNYLEISGGKTYNKMGDIFPCKGRTEKALSFSLLEKLRTSSVISSTPEQKQRRWPLNSLFMLFSSIRTS